MSKLIMISLLMAGSAAAQSNTLRRHHPVSVTPHIAGEATLMTVVPNEGGMARVSWTSATLPSLESTFDLPFQWVGGVCRVSDDQFLCSGHAPTSPPIGYLVRLQLVPGSGIVVRETAAYPGVDPFSIAWHPHLGCLALVDIAGDAMLFSPFFGVGDDVADPVLPSNSMMAVGLTAFDLPALASDWPHIRFDPREQSLVVSANPKFAGTHIAWGAGQWGILQTHRTTPEVWHADAETGALSPLRVMLTGSSLASQTYFKVRHLRTGAVVGSGTVSALAHWVAIGAPPEFFEYPGDEFLVEGVVGASSRKFRPLVRYGEQEATSVIGLGRALVNPTTVFVNSSGAGFWTDISVPGLPQAGGSQVVTTTAYLLLGLGTRGSGAPPDPVVGHGLGARLQFVVALEYQVGAMRRNSRIGARVPIPLGPEFEGSVVFSQWAVLDPVTGAPVYSDIVGTRIHGASGSAMMAAATAGLQSAASSVAIEQSMADGGALEDVAPQQDPLETFRAALSALPQSLAEGSPTSMQLRSNAGL